MNKEQLIARNAGVKLYDLSDSKDMNKMNTNLNYCIKNNKEPSFKLIAPFGHPLNYKADFYYFESENTPITEQILEEMGFVNYEYYIRSLTIRDSLNGILLENQTTNIKTANQLHQLIQLLS